MKRMLSYLLLTAGCTASAWAGEVKDPLAFPASQGKVVFWHFNHVNEVKGDCTVCHPGTPGKIAGFGKESAHKLCVGCHEPREGMPEGPTNCDGCHTK